MIKLSSGRNQLAIMSDAPDETSFAFFRIIWIIASIRGSIYSMGEG